jgi:hypothetical protein
VSPCTSAVVDDPVLAGAQLLDLELLAWLDAIELAQLGRKHDLPLDDMVVLMHVR